MEINEMIGNVKKTLKKILRNRKYKKELDEHNRNVDMLQSLMECSGELNQCKSSYFTAIRQQQRNIRNGKEEGFDTTAQRNLLKEAALGYLVVEEAMFSLKSMGSYNQILRAYAMLDSITKDVTGKKGRFSKRRQLDIDDGEDLISQFNSDEKLAELGAKVENHLDELAVTKDIEASMKRIRFSSLTESNAPNGSMDNYNSNSNTASYMRDTDYRQTDEWLRSNTETNPISRNLDPDEQEKFFGGFTPPMGG